MEPTSIKDPRNPAVCPSRAPSAEDVRKQLRQILASVAFRGSHRGSKFLEYIVENALNSRLDRLKERTVGIEVFGREADYDTGVDAIVRVTAGDVRKRLLSYYTSATDFKGVRIDLPSGSYAPEFHFVENGSRRKEDRLEPATESTAAPARSDRRIATRSQLPVTAAAIAVSCLAIGLVAGLLAVRYSIVPSRIVQRNSSAYGPNGFYRELLGPMADDSSSPVEVAFSNPQVLLYIGSSDKNFWRSVPRMAPVPPEQQRILDGILRDDTTDMDFLNTPYRRLLFAPHEYTGMGEAVTGSLVARLLQQLNRSSQLTQMRFLNWEDVRKKDLIVLGAPHLSNWVRQSMESLDLTFGVDTVLNARPRAGEQSAYPRQYLPNGTIDYGMIWMTRSPSGRPFLLLAGLGSEGTEGVGEFFCDPQRMRPIYEQLKAASKDGMIPSHWQVLLKITSRDGIPVSVTFLTLRVYQ